MIAPNFQQSFQPKPCTVWIPPARVVSRSGFCAMVMLEGDSGAMLHGSGEPGDPRFMFIRGLKSKDTPVIPENGYIVS